MTTSPLFLSFLGSAGKEFTCNGGLSSNPWVGKVPGRRHTVMQPGEFT